MSFLLPPLRGTRRFGIMGKSSRELLTQGGLIIVHDDRAEMEFLFPEERIVEVPEDEGATIPLPLVRGMEPVTFPLNRKDFRQ